MSESSVLRGFALLGSATAQNQALIALLPSTLALRAGCISIHATHFIRSRNRTT
jgi:hypothetical protein